MTDSLKPQTSDQIFEEIMEDIVIPDSKLNEIRDWCREELEDVIAEIVDSEDDPLSLRTVIRGVAGALVAEFKNREPFGEEMMIEFTPRSSESVH